MNRTHQVLWMAALMLLGSVILISGSATHPLQAAELAAPGDLGATLALPREPLAQQSRTWVIADQQVSATEAAVGDTLVFTLTFDVGDFASFPITVTDHLSSSLALESVWSSQGVLTYDARNITCTAQIEPGSPLVIEFRARLLTPGITTNVAFADTDGHGQAYTPVVMITTGMRHDVYLPAVITLRPAPGIYGRATINGKPVDNSGGVELRFFDGYSWSTRARASISWQTGDFKFLNVPSLQPGQLYYVLYERVSSRYEGLLLWTTRTLTSYNTADAVTIGAFDIADAPLLAPANKAAVYFPVTFRWGPRAIMPTDDYEFNLFDPYDLDPYLYGSMGYTDQFTLYTLPPVLNVGDLYARYIGIYSLDGGYGMTDPWLVYFENTGLRTAPFDAQAQLLQRIEAQKVQRQ